MDQSWMPRWAAGRNPRARRLGKRGDIKCGAGLLVRDYACRRACAGPQRSGTNRQMASAASQLA